MLSFLAKFKKAPAPVLAGSEPADEHTSKSKEMDVSEVPLSIIIGFLPGIKQKDADSYVRGLMGKISHDLHNTGYNLIKFRGGIAYEIQEGGAGHSWLKSILSLLETHQTIIVPAGSRFIKIELEESGIHCSLLRVTDNEKEKALTPAKGSKLKAYHNYVQVWVSTTTAVAAFSIAFFSLTLLAQQMITEKNIEKKAHESMTKTQTLPMFFWPKVVDDDVYVAKLEFINGNWKPPIFKSFKEEEVKNKEKQAITEKMEKEMARRRALSEQQQIKPDPVLPLVTQ